MAKTRYLQLTDTVMFEYDMYEPGDSVGLICPSTAICTRLKDDHLSVLYPISEECEYDVDTQKYKKKMNPNTLVTLNHLSVPEDKDLSMWYYFNDPDYEFVDSDIFDTLGSAAASEQIKVREYSRYLSYPISGQTGDPLSYSCSSFDVHLDTMRLYFVNGYDFSNVYGMVLRVYVYGEDDVVDLCDFCFTRDNAYKLIKYLASPILLGNDVYDRYIEINLPCVYDLINERGEGDNASELVKLLKIKNDTKVRIMFSAIFESDITIESVDYNINGLLDPNNPPISLPVNVSYVRSTTINGTIPTQNTNSDNLGCYISEVPDKPYVQFYATWRNKPLTKDIVWRFNKGIILYDTSLVYNGRAAEYDVPSDYQAEHSERKWVAMHELKLTFAMGSTIIKEETYSMNQIFVSDNDPAIFYYRPLIFDETNGLFVDNINIVYTMRFINTDDKVQFIKVASLALIGNMGRYYATGTNLMMGNTTPYKVYNKIIENKSNSPDIAPNAAGTRFVKTFYNTTDVVMDTNDGNLYGQYGYTLNISQAPKSYKFIFKNKGADGKYAYMDMTDGYYKLMFSDKSGAVNLIEPTYSSNMNMNLGQLEFNLSMPMIKKLMDIEEQNRKMSIVVSGEDGSVSSLFDFKFNI